MTRAAAATIVLALFLSGCTGEPAAPGADADVAAGAIGAFLPPVVLPGVRGGPEPTLAVAPDGVMYVGAQDPVGEGPRVWISRDGGASWTEARPTREGGGELSLAAGPDGAVYVTQLGAHGNVVSVSRDHGRTWTTSPIGSPTQYFDRQWAAVDAAGRAYLLAREFGDRTSASVARSDDGGLTWVPRGRAWDPEHRPGVANGNLVAAHGALYLPYACNDGASVCVAVSRDRGESWTQHGVTNHGDVQNVYPALAVFGPDHVIVTWSSALDGTLAVWSSTSRDGGRSWSPAVRSTPEGSGTATLPWVAGTGERAWVVHLWTPAKLTSTDGADAAGAEWTPVAVPVSPATGVALGEPIPLTEEPVHVGVISKPMGRPSRDAPFDRNFGDFFTALVDADGRLHVAVSRDHGTPESTRDLVVSERRR